MIRKILTSWHEDQHGRLPFRLVKLFWLCTQTSATSHYLAVTWIFLTVGSLSVGQSTI